MLKISPNPQNTPRQIANNSRTAEIGIAAEHPGRGPVLLYLATPVPLATVTRLASRRSTEDMPQVKQFRELLPQTPSLRGLEHLPETVRA
jgi:hypothetical protein